MRSVAFAFTLAFAAASSVALAKEALDAPPIGLTPTSASVTAILHKYHEASDFRAPSGRERWTLELGSEKGTRSDVWTADALRTDETLGPYHNAYGQVNGHAWHMNENGEVAPESGLHQRDDVDSGALARSKTAYFTVLGISQKPVPSYVLKLNPPHGRIEYLFFDTTSGDLVRRIAVRDGRRVTTTYQDFRAEGRAVIAHHLRIEDGKAENTTDMHLVSAEFNARVAPSEVAEPTPAPPIATLGTLTHATLPGKIIDDRVILPFSIGKHVVNFQLDSGADGIVIDHTVVQALGYHEYGRIIGETAGAYVESDVTIPTMKLGALTIANAHARSLPFVNFADASTPVAGLMGYDLIANLVIHIDYDHGTVEAFEPSAFTPPAGATRIAIGLDDDVPLVHATISTATNVPFVLDTGADRSALFSSFIREYPSAASDRGLGDEMTAAFPFVDDLSGVGGSVDYRPLQVGPFTFGGSTFDRWLFDVTQNAPTFEIEDYNGLIGQDVLRYYDLYLDYQHGCIYVSPNARYRERYG
ncbi:MAG: aspartyl protease family protein [bacterium]|nr:aspartyl protease family protein [bacterium]